jgi:Zn-dependent protease
LGVNLLPIFPLDGGRIFQSLLYFILGRRKAVITTSGISLVLLIAATVLTITTKNYFYLFMMPLLAISNLAESWNNLTSLSKEESENS